ncbi:Methyladenine glycosylase [Musa troglodytarum]|uniref:Methyladenine glycosylase n=1 Tax=Musa troglodytarum TaxID=320322 RepID=A0A9E7JMI7_9LILI|nr:Methyladenine glycosylase [Musa troglodytarum]
MSGAPKVRSLNVADPEARPVLVPGGNKARSVATAQKPTSKPLSKTEGGAEVAAAEEKKASSPTADLPHFRSSLSASSALRRHEMLLPSNLSMNASCSSEASTDSFCSRASTGRIDRASLISKRRQSVPRTGKIVNKVDKNISDDAAMPPLDLVPGKRKCAWVTPNTEPCYACFHDEEWGVPVHDGQKIYRKLFELLVLSGALAELTWPVILSKRHMFREVFLDFDPVAVSKLNEKKIVVPGSTASSLLSEPKLRAIIENARQILKVVDEFGSFERYCWSFVNHKPIVNPWFLIIENLWNKTSVVQAPTHDNNYLQVPNGYKVFSSQWWLGGHSEVGGRHMIAMKSLPSTGSSH